MSGVSGCQGALWSEQLDGKELHGAACDLEPRGSPFLDIVYMVNPFFFIYYKCDMPILKKWCSSTNIRFRKFASSNLRVELALSASVVRSGRVIP